MKKIFKIRYIIILSIIIVLMLSFKITMFDKNTSIKPSANSSAQKVEREYQGLIVNADKLVLSIDGQIPSESDMKNNTVYLQQCIDIVSEAGGGKVVIPSGTFYFRQADETGREGTSYYVIKCRDNVIVEGAGTDEITGTILKPYAPNNDLPVDMFFFNEIAVSGNAIFLKNADYRNFVIDGAEAYSTTYNSAGKGFMINLFEDCDWDNVVVKNTDGTGFGVDCPINSTIKNCKAENCGKGGKQLADKAPGASGFGIGTGYSDDESFLISNCESVDNLKFGYFFEHQSRFFKPQTNLYKATKSNGFVVQNCISSGNMYDFGGARANDVTYENCISNKKTKTRKAINFENISRRVHMVNCKVNNTFIDVEPTSSYYDAINWAVNNGITEGISSNEFGISNECKRYQVIMFLYRMAGRPGNVAFYSGIGENYVSVNGDRENAFNTGYSDLPEKYVTFSTEEALLEAIKWAQDVGILEVPSNEIPFGVGEDCTMSQLFNWIYAYVLEGEGEITEEDSYDWVVENGLLDGIDDDGNILSRICTRAEVVKILYNVSKMNNTYSITYNLMGGTMQNENLEYKSGEDSFRLSIPTKYGYTFEGWTGSTYSEYIEENYRPQVEARISINDVGDKIFTANWIANNYTVSFDANGGEGTMEKQYFMYDDVPQALLENSFTRAGYVFEGWKDENGKLYIDNNNDGLIPVRNLTTVQNGNVKLYAQWSALSVQYKVEHYRQALNGEYPETLKETEPLNGYSGTSVTPEVKEYEGFTSPEKQAVEIDGDGSTVVKYYYKRKTYKVTVEKGKGIESVTGEGRHKYEEEVTLRAQLKEGYGNEQWSSEPTFTMPAEDVSLEVSATPITYTIKYNLNGGSVTGNPQTYTVESENIILKQPIKQHYEFIGWTGSNGNTVQKEVVIEKGTIGNKEYIANWKRIDTTYKVEHYRQALNGEYPETLKETEPLNGYSGTSVTPEVKEYEGFTSPEKQAVEIAGDGSTVVKYYYTRKTYKVTVEKGKGIESVTGEGRHKYEEEVTLRAQLKEGYGNEQWSSEPTFTMPAEDVSLEVSATPITYIIKYNLNGGSVTGNPQTYTVESENIILKQPIKQNYEFIGWTGSNGNTVQKEVVIEKGTTGNKEYIANWERVDTTYKVEHYRQALNGEYPETLKETETLNGYSGTSVTPEVKEYEGFTSPEKQAVEIAGDGSTVVKYYYKRNTYTLTVKKGDGVDSIQKSETYKFEEKVVLKAILQKGHKDINWDWNIDLGENIETKEYDNTTSILEFLMPANNDIEILVYAIPKDDILISESLVVDEQKLIVENIHPDTTEQEIRKVLKCEMEFEIIDEKGVKISQISLIGTGYKIKMENDKVYTLIVKGDINSDGKANIKDILGINKHRLNKVKLTEEYLLAADINKDEKVDIRDILKINKFRLGKTNQL